MLLNEEISERMGEVEEVTVEVVLWSNYDKCRRRHGGDSGGGGGGGGGQVGGLVEMSRRIKRNRKGWLPSRWIERIGVLLSVEKLDSSMGKTQFSLLLCSVLFCSVLLCLGKPTTTTENARAREKSAEQ
ncbi:hypothetical protein M0804_002922 [Polistes exclamans]|nr:hypothetical protein M0804_002922 [Polistes exclamans]